MVWACGYQSILRDVRNVELDEVGFLQNVIKAFRLKLPQNGLDAIENRKRSSWYDFYQF